MGRHTSIIPVKSVHELLKVDPAYRVSAAAAQQVRVYLESLGRTVAEHAQHNALHRGKKTVEQEDVELAFKQAVR